MEIEIVTQKQTAETIKIKVPCYVRFDECYMKIKDQNYCVVVKDYPFNMGIEIKNMAGYDPFGNEGWKFVTETEFNVKYEKVLLNIRSNK